MGGFADLDNDGDFDLVFPGADHVLLNDGAANFTPSTGFVPESVSDPRSVAFADVDLDGDLDFFYAQKQTTSRLIRNDAGGPNRWIRLQLTDDGQAGANGARVAVYEPGRIGEDEARITWWEVRSQDGYLSQSDPSVHLGVGGRRIVDIRVVFLSGAQIDIEGVETNTLHSVSSE
jgi:hypothetical protein